MNDNERFVYLKHDLEPDECHLVGCDQPVLRITALLVIVHYSGVAVPMHPSCALRFARNVHLKELQELCKQNAAWN